jgi:hypothetical protein
MCITLMVTTAAVIVGTVVVRPTLRNRMLQLYLQWKVRARDAITTLLVGHNRRRPVLMSSTFVSSVMALLLLRDYWIVIRADNYIQHYVIRPDHMYKHPLATVLVADCFVFLWPQRHHVRWYEALAVLTLYYAALYSLSTVTVSLKDKSAYEIDSVEELCVMMSDGLWYLLIFEWKYLVVDSICITAMICKKLVTVITTATIVTAVKLAYHKCRAAAYMALQAAAEHTLRTLSRTEFRYTRDMMTTCTRCHKSIAIAVNIPCGHTFLCWSCATQYRDTHDEICNSCHEDSTLVKLHQQQMCVICQELVSGHVLFHIKQCGHQVYTHCTYC